MAASIRVQITLGCNKMRFSSEGTKACSSQQLQRHPAQGVEHEKTQKMDEDYTEKRNTQKADPGRLTGQERYSKREAIEREMGTEVGCHATCSE